MINKALDEAEKGGFEYDRNSVHWGRMTTEEGYYRLIFNHQFMKAIFGNGQHYDRLYEVETKASEEDNREPQYEFLPLPLYKSMLQQMAIAEDPLKWLCSAIDKKTNLENLGEGVVSGTKDTSAIREQLRQQFRSSL